jgi:hypothetical protein
MKGSQEEKLFLTWPSLFPFDGQPRSARIRFGLFDSHIQFLIGAELLSLTNLSLTSSDRPSCFLSFISFSTIVLSETLWPTAISGCLRGHTVRPDP